MQKIEALFINDGAENIDAQVAAFLAELNGQVGQAALNVQQRKLTKEIEIGKIKLEVEAAKLTVNNVTVVERNDEGKAIGFLSPSDVLYNVKGRRTYLAQWEEKLEKAEKLHNSLILEAEKAEKEALDLLADLTQEITPVQ